MKTITLNIPDGQRIGKSIYQVVRKKLGKLTATDTDICDEIYHIEDQDLLSLLQKIQ